MYLYKFQLFKINVRYVTFLKKCNTKSEFANEMLQISEYKPNFYLLYKILPSEMI